MYGLIFTKFLRKLVDHRKRLYISKKHNVHMSTRKRKTAKFDPEEINNLAQDKPVVYEIFDRSGFGTKFNSPHSQI